MLIHHPIALSWPLRLALGFPVDLIFISATVFARFFIYIHTLLHTYMSFKLKCINFVLQICFQVRFGSVAAVIDEPDSFFKGYGNRSSESFSSYNDGGELIFMLIL